MVFRYIFSINYIFALIFNIFGETIPSTINKILITLFPVLGYLNNVKTTAELETNRIMSSVERKIGNKLSNINSFRNKLDNILSSDTKNAQIQKLKSELENAQEQALEQSQTQAQAQSQPQSQGTTNTPEEKTLNTDQLRQELESNTLLTGGYRKNKKIKRKAKVGYKRFRKSQL